MHPKTDLALPSGKQRSCHPERTQSPRFCWAPLLIVATGSQEGVNSLSVPPLHVCAATYTLRSNRGNVSDVTASATVRLKPGHVQPVWAGHPWIYAQAVDRVEGGAMRGDEVRVTDPRGNFLGRGFYSPGSAIPVRIVTRDEQEPIDLHFFKQRIARARKLRDRLGLEAEGNTGYRLLHADGDGVPGLIIDRFDDVYVVQFLTFGMKAREQTILNALAQQCAPRAIIDRTPATAGRSEQFTPTQGVVYGKEITELVFTERKLRYRIPLDLGQKTGFYFDQRPLRARVEALAKGAKVLDTYAYACSFGMAASRGGAVEVTSVDENALALEVGAACARDNGLAGPMSFLPKDARKVLQEAKGAYDLVICDPPRLAPTRSAREQALVHYAKLAELSCRATKPGGLVVVCSCSAAVDLAALTRALGTGALRANVRATVLERHFQGADHPVSAAFGEGLYLKALVALVEPR